jgi:hypothetical protein
MENEKISVFRTFPFHKDQKIHIENGLRRGDWLVVGVSDRKVKLRCPVSGREFEWDRFCYFAEERQDREWPRQG